MDLDNFEIVGMSCFYYETARNMPINYGKDFILLTKMILMYYVILMNYLKKKNVRSGTANELIGIEKLIQNESHLID